ncbi:MAG: hypothetical protein ACREIA_03210 [Opitutaceae bacterium]
MSLLRALVFLLGAVLLSPPGSRATTVIPPTFDELVERSALVIRTHVVDTRCEWRGEGENHHIVTVVSLAVDETIVGDAAGTIELEFFGGEIDGERQFVSGQTLFARGQEALISPEAFAAAIRERALQTGRGDISQK